MSARNKPAKNEYISVAVTTADNESEHTTHEMTTTTNPLLLYSVITVVTGPQ